MEAALLGAREDIDHLAVSGPFLVQRALERKAWTATETFPTGDDKSVRCQFIRGRMELSGLYVPANASWLPDLRVELVPFPYGAHDDQCDALGLAGQLLDKHVKARKPLPDPEEKSFDDYQTKVSDLLANSFMTM